MGEGVGVSWGCGKVGGSAGSDWVCEIRLGCVGKASGVKWGVEREV